MRDDGIYVSVPAEPEHRRTVSDVMVETMTNWGVTKVFGMVGHSNLGLLLTNASLGKISKEQRDGQLAVWQTALHNPNFAEYARMCGALGIRVAKIDELDAALAHEGPALVEVMQDPLLL